jgi:hypothetical protein
VISVGVRLMITPILLLTLSVVAASAQTDRVDEVRIRSQWSGLGPSAMPHATEVLIQKRGDAFYSNGERVDAGLIERLVTLLSQPAIPAPDAYNLGISNPGWTATSSQRRKAAAETRLSRAMPPFSSHNSERRSRTVPESALSFPRFSQSITRTIIQRSR